MDCPNCGKQNADDGPKCSSCGWELACRPFGREGTRRVSPLLIVLFIASAALLPFLLLFGLFGITPENGSTVEYADISDDFIARYQSIYQVDRKVMGFPPLPLQGTVKVEIIDREDWNYGYDPPEYDVLLHFYEKGDNDRNHTERYIALRRIDSAFQWIYESMTFHGPKEYLDDERLPSKERLSLKWEMTQGAEEDKQTIAPIITYSGPDERLVGEAGWTIDGGDLSLANVIPVLREWGYVYEIAEPDSPASHAARSQWLKASVCTDTQNLIVLWIDYRDRLKPVLLNHDYATLLFCNDGDARFYIFDNIRKKHFSTQDYDLFLQELSSLKDGSTVIPVLKCGGPFSLEMPREEYSRFSEVVERKKFVTESEEDQLFVVCVCESYALKFADNYRWQWE